MQATTLTFVIVATQIAIAAGQVSRTTGAALLAVGLLSATLFPPLAVKLLSADGADEGSAACARRAPGAGTERRMTSVTPAARRA